MDLGKRILTAIELHSPEKIQECLDEGVSPNQVMEGKSLVYALINMYTRGPRFKECMRVFVDNGLVFEDKLLLSVLLDDADELDRQLSSGKDAPQYQYSIDCAFTPLKEASLLHICAEYNHVASAEVLVRHGVNVNATAGLDENGFGGQTAVFHTVNQHANLCIDMLKFLISANADLGLTVKGLTWGKGYSWETFIPSVNPISYAMMGLLPQFQRTEEQIYEIVALLLKARYGIDYYPENIPNRYLYGTGGSKD